MSFTGMHHMVVRVKDLDEGVKTWRDRLGLELDRIDENDALGIKQAFFNLANGGFIEIVAPINDDSAVGKAVASRARACIQWRWRSRISIRRLNNWRKTMLP